MATSKASNAKLIGITIVGAIVAVIAAESDRFMWFLVISLCALVIFAVGRALYRSF